MPLRNKAPHSLFVFAVVAAFFVSGNAESAEPVSFNRDVRPILAAKCFACHGPDEKQRKAELRLDVRDDAIAKKAFVAGKPNESESVRRVTSNDADERMPPAGADQLTAKEKSILHDWIAAGAKYEKHWAFIPPMQPEPSQVNNADWPRNEIDRFVLARLERDGYGPSPEADRYTLCRRVYLDLIGLPPTPEEADAFVNDDDPRAYEKMVDRLLKSSHYGERWARAWLDLARYSDTNGYEKDRPRSIWPYRDWVIKALNDDMPFDQFTIEQLAGDMLPNATLDQRIATGFHRNTMLNEEGGIDPLEYRFYAMVDRVGTTGTVWMGLTTGCAQCHSHKYDPISHADYYRMMALLNNADEPDLIVPDESIAEQRGKIEEQIAALEADLPNKFPPIPGQAKVEKLRAMGLELAFGKWVEEQRKSTVEWSVIRPHHLATNLPKLEVMEDGSVFSSGDVTKRDVFTMRFRIEEPTTALRLEALPDERLPAGGPGRAYYEGRKGDFFLSDVTARVSDKPIKFSNASHTFGKIAVGSGNTNATNVIDGQGSTGWSTATREGEAHRLVLNLAEPIEAPCELEVEMLFERHFVASLGRFRFSATTSSGEVKANKTPVEVQELLTKSPDLWNEEQRQRVMQHFLRVIPELAKAHEEIAKLRGQLPALPTTMVMLERAADNPRRTHRHHRGEFLSPREEVTPGVLAIFSQDDGDQPTDRLEFARWLVSARNPLIGRVTVNRAWRAFFGIGLMHTSGDFGTQSEPPSHPELLDWLACEFVAQGWSMKKLHRLIVMSATYRQGWAVTREFYEQDPLNRLLARGPRFRLDAEVIRDSALTGSGLLSPQLGGPSVFPPQPASVTAISYGGTSWKVSEGEDRYRRSLYTFNKRTAPFAAYLVFDGPTGENCVPRRLRSSTPLQALTLLNSEMFLEMGQAVAELAATKPSDHRAAFIFRRFATRPPTEKELKILTAFQQTHLKRFETGELDAKLICGKASATAELASWVMVARAIMNLDEVIVRP